MKRWNGWGEDSINPHLPNTAQAMLAEKVGAANPGPSTALEKMVDRVPQSNLKPHRLLRLDPETRVKHARGQSFRDWVELRHGTVDTFPDAVAFPETEADVRELMSLAVEQDAIVIPYGGGTSVVGHLTPPKSQRPVITISTERMSTLLKLDETSQLATFGAGILGPNLEAALQAKGYTLGHYPQSFEYSTLGGWVAARSSGQQSLGYGRIEDLFAGGRIITPKGDLDMPPLPASGAGPDVRQIVLGSEGRMGIITSAVVRIRKTADVEHFHAIFFPDWQRAETAVRELSQAGLPLSMMRLSNPIETETNLALAGKERLIATLKRYLAMRKVRDHACMLLIGFTGDRRTVKHGKSRALDISGRHGGVHMWKALGKAWRRNRFKTPYFRNLLWDYGYGVDTLETCVTWDRIGETMNGIEQAVREAGETLNEKVHVYTHLSHFYGSGASIYTTYLFRLQDTPEATLDFWWRMKSAASDFLTSRGGTISHQHGVGLDHKPWLVREKGELGLASLRAALHSADPTAMMNPGKLLD